LPWLSNQLKVRIHLTQDPEQGPGHCQCQLAQGEQAWLTWAVCTARPATELCVSALLTQQGCTNLSGTVSINSYLKPVLQDLTGRSLSARCSVLHAKYSCHQHPISALSPYLLSCISAGRGCVGAYRLPSKLVYRNTAGVCDSSRRGTYRLLC